MEPTRAQPTLAWSLLVVGATAAGFIGWLQAGAGVADAAYQTLQMFLLEFPHDHEPINVGLQIGRFGAAAATGTAVLLLGARYLGERFSRARMHRLSGHTVLIGCGQTGAMILESLTAAELPQNLLVVDRSPDALVQARHRGAHTVERDARDEGALARARAGKAQRVIVAVDDWGVATEIARIVTEMRSEKARSRKLTSRKVTSNTILLTHLDDLTLSHAVRLRFLRQPETVGDVFNLQENAARKLLSTYDDRLAGDVEGPTRIVLIGGDRIAEALVLQAVRSWLGSLREFPLQIRVVGEDAGTVLDSITNRWPAFGHVLAGCQAVDVSPMRFAMSGDLVEGDRVVVDLLDGDHAVAVGAALLEHNPPIKLDVLGHTQPKKGLSGVTVRSLPDLALSVDTIDSDSLWQMAASLHEIYRQGALADSSPHGGRWEQLPQPIQEDNRRAALFLLKQLPEHAFAINRATPDYVRCSVEDLAAVIDPVRCERLARAEHARWVSDRSTSCEPPARFTDPWAELSEDAREHTRTTVSMWPRLLLRFGYQLVDTLAVADPDRLLGNGHRYRRDGEVRANRTDQAQMWRTSDGQPLAALPGDWVIDDGGHRWSVRKEVFHLSYEHLEGDRYRRIGVVDAVQLGAPYHVTTPEGDLIAAQGDWLLRDETGDVWVVTENRFTTLYLPA